MGLFVGFLKSFGTFMITMNLPEEMEYQNILEYINVLIVGNNLQYNKEQLKRLTNFIWGAIGIYCSYEGFIMENMNDIKKSNVYMAICIVLVSIIFIGICIGLYEISYLDVNATQNGTIPVHKTFDKIVDLWNGFNSK